MEELLQLYSLFKQSIIGDNETTKPGFLDLQGRAKWDAWTKVKGTSKEAAQAQYVALVKSLQAKQK
ncbi:Acyl-CoA-binding domain-containing protein 2 [Irineochytrium annulatum]|nr:Acyl-CoA-binding domain-containing protein 2 [Irineochytrium annulatum]